MAITFILRSTLPVVTKGKAATEPKITISDKGQMTINSKGVEFLQGNGRVGIAFDADTSKLYFLRHDHKQVVPLEDKDVMIFKAPKSKDGKKPKSNVLTASFGSILQRGFGKNGEPPTTIYDYRNSGSQTFSLTPDLKNLRISFTLPNGALPKTSVARPRRKKPTGQVTNGAEVAGKATTTTNTPPPPPVDTLESDIVLEDI